MAAGPESRLLSLPVENLISIYICCHDIPDAVALSGTCRRLRDIFTAHRNVIARGHIFRSLSPSDFKLGVMAVVSQGVDPRNRGAVERFLATYVQKADWPASTFSLEVAAALPNLVRAADALAECAFHWFMKTSFTISPTEHARKVRSAFMVEIAANLFYRVPDESSTLLWKALFPDLEKAFWEAFSFGEIWQAYEMRNPLASFVSEVEWRIFDHDYYSDCQDPVGCAHERERWNRTYPTHASNCLIGIENIYSWLEDFHNSEKYGAFRPSHIQKTVPEKEHEDGRALSIKVGGSVQHGPSHPLCVKVKGFAMQPKPQNGLYWPRTLYSAALDTISKGDPPRPRFQPDPESVSDETWAWDEQKMAEIHYTWHGDLWRFPKTLVDKATWSDMAEKFRQPSPNRFFTMGVVPSMEFYQFGRTQSIQA